MPGSDQSRRTFLHEFLTMSRLKISTVRLDGGSEFGKSSSFIAYCTQHDIVRAPLASCTHIQNARADGAIKICKEHVRLDHLQPHELRHNLVKDLHAFGSYVTSHLPLVHLHVADTTHDDRAEEVVFLANDLTTPDFWMYSFRAKDMLLMATKTAMCL
jgi:hypothetical protein